jgi:PXA domain-containing protein
MTALGPTRIQTDSKLAPSRTGDRTPSPFPQSIDDRATTSYIRRTLCAHHAISSGPPKSIHELLPPLTSSNGLDLQLYAIIAVVLKEFVQSWYGKITPDHIFIDEILRVISHCARALEERIRKVDLEALVLDEIPRLIDSHISGMYAENYALNQWNNDRINMMHLSFPNGTSIDRL